MTDLPVIAAVAAVVAALEGGLALYILNDHRARLVRLEDLFFSRRGRAVAEVLHQQEG